MKSWKEYFEETKSDKVKCSYASFDPLLPNLESLCTFGQIYNEMEKMITSNSEKKFWTELDAYDALVVKMKKHITDSNVKSSLREKIIKLCNDYIKIREILVNKIESTNNILKVMQ